MMILSQQACKGCGLKLTMFEIQEKDAHCMDCYNESREKSKSSAGEQDIFARRKNTRRYAWYYHHQARTAD